MRKRGLGFGLAAVLLGACGTTLPSPDAASPSAAPAAPSPTPIPAVARTRSPAPSPSASPTSAWTWTPVDGTQLDSQSLRGVTTLPDRCLLAFSSDRSAAMWRSADAVTWTRDPDSPAMAPARRGWSTSIGDVAATPFGLVAVGSEGDAGDTLTERAAAWIATDGHTWERAVVTGGADRSMDTIVVTNDGLVALGPQVFDPPWYGSDRDGTAVWTSHDGRSWHHVPASDAIPLGVRLHDVSTLGDRFYALASWVGERVSPRLPRLWSSRDAVRWKPVKAAPKRIYSIASTGDLLLGNGDPGSPDESVTWVTRDGRRWTRANPTSPTGPTEAFTGGILVAGEGEVFTVGVEEDPETLDGVDRVWRWVGDGWAAIEPPRSFTDLAFGRDGFPVDAGLLVVTDGDPASPGPSTLWLLAPPVGAEPLLAPAPKCDVP